MSRQPNTSKTLGRSSTGRKPRRKTQRRRSRSQSARVSPAVPAVRGVCRHCGMNVPDKRKSFCSEECADDWAAAHSPTLLRQRVFRRDQGICALCGMDCVLLGRALSAEWERVKMAVTAREQAERAEFRKRYRWFLRRRTCWDADHIVPVSEGGGNCTMANIRTLCVPCHQQVTKTLSRKKASQRRQQRRPTAAWILASAD